MAGVNIIKVSYSSGTFPCNVSLCKTKKQFVTSRISVYIIVIMSDVIFKLFIQTTNINDLLLLLKGAVAKPGRASLTSMPEMIGFQLT